MLFMDPVTMPRRPGSWVRGWRVQAFHLTGDAIKRKN